MTALLGTNVAALIIPFDSADTFPTHDSQYGLGGWHEVADDTARDAIPVERLRAGMCVYVTGDSAAYTWTGVAWLKLIVLPRYDMAIYFTDNPTANLYILDIPMVVAVTLPAGLTGSKFRIRVNPTATMTFTLYQTGVSVGTVSFNTSGVASVSFPSPVTFTTTDDFAIQAPALQDATGAGIGFTLVFTR